MIKKVQIKMKLFIFLTSFTLSIVSCSLNENVIRKINKYSTVYAKEIKKGIWIEATSDSSYLICQYKKGVKYKYSKVISKKGNKLAEGNYVNDLKEGAWLFYNFKGEIIKKIWYVDNKELNVWEYDSTGVIRTIINCPGF